MKWAVTLASCGLTMALTQMPRPQGLGGVSRQRRAAGTTEASQWVTGMTITVSCLPTALCFLVPGVPLAGRRPTVPDTPVPMDRRSHFRWPADRTPRLRISDVPPAGRQPAPTVVLWRLCQ